MTFDRRLRLPTALILLLVIVALAAPLLPLHDPLRMQVIGRLKPPSGAYPLGQDEFGRDVLSRLIWGARTSLAVAVSATGIAAVVGTALGLIGGYFRGIVEMLTVRLSEVVLCFPPFLLALLIVTIMGPGAGTLVATLAVLFAPAFARLAYAETLSVSARDFVTAQQAIGTQPMRILRVTLLPNIAPPLLVQFALTMASALLLESGLSFLGLGVVPPAPSWGSMIRGARGTMEQAPLLLLWPCLALTLTILAFNLLCARLRHVLDPRGVATIGLFGRARTAKSVATLQQPMDAILDITGLTISIDDDDKSFAAVRDVNLRLEPGDTLAIVGESGSGKTLTALAMMGLLKPPVSLSAGNLRYRRRDGSLVEMSTLREEEMRQLRGNEIAMIFQDAGASLNPVWRIGTQIAEGVRVHSEASRQQAEARAVDLLRNVGLSDPEIRARSFPHEVSGGQRQRAMIAGAIANHPRVLIADEPTTALDVTIQKQILDLLRSLRERDPEMILIFITHNLAVARDVANRVAVMYAGEIVEEGPVSAVFATPRHPYTAALLTSMPEAKAGKRLNVISGTVPNPGGLPAGCVFGPRCSRRQPSCEAQRPALVEIGEERRTRCLHWETMP